MTDRRSFLGALAAADRGGAARKQRPHASTSHRSPSHGPLRATRGAQQPGAGDAWRGSTRPPLGPESPTDGANWWARPDCSRRRRGLTLGGEVWVPLAEPAEFRFEIDVGKKRVAERRIRLSPPRRWTLYWLSTNHTDVGYTDLQERALEVHRKNLDAALARLATDPDYRWSAECELQIMSYLENRSQSAGEALVTGDSRRQDRISSALREPAHRAPRSRDLRPRGVARGAVGAIAGTGLRQRANHGRAGASPDFSHGPGGERRALPGERAQPRSGGAAPVVQRRHRRTDSPDPGHPYPQLYWWESPDGSRVLHWRNHHYGDGLRYGFNVGAERDGAPALRLAL